jgi:hypothetical protein
MHGPRDAAHHRIHKGKKLKLFILFPNPPQSFILFKKNLAEKIPFFGNE